MEARNEVVIPLSKIKLVLLVFGTALFVLVGIWLLSLEPEQIQSWRKMPSPQIVYVVSYICIAMFGLCGLFGIVKMFDSKPGLIINSEGITDNSSGVAAGLIRWSEITGFSEYQVQNSKMLIIHVKDPEKYVNRGSLMKRALNKFNMKMAGSPISISSTTLKVEYKELLQLCESSFKQYGQDA